MQLIHAILPAAARSGRVKGLLAYIQNRIETVNDLVQTRSLILVLLRHSIQGSRYAGILRPHVMWRTSARYSTNAR